MSDKIDRIGRQLMKNRINSLKYSIMAAMSALAGLQRDYRTLTGKDYVPSGPIVRIPCDFDFETYVDIPVTIYVSKSDGNYCIEDIEIQADIKNHIRTMYEESLRKEAEGMDEE